MTTAIVASSLRSAIASMSACRLLPRPEMRTRQAGGSTRHQHVGHRRRLAGDDLSDHTRVAAAARGKLLDERLGLIARRDDDQADAHVERAHHVVDRQRCRSRCSQRKSGGTSHDGHSTTARGAVRKHARQVVGNAAAGDVRHALDAAGVEQRLRSAADTIDAARAAPRQRFVDSSGT